MENEVVLPVVETPTASDPGQQPAPADTTAEHQDGEQGEQGDKPAEKPEKTAEQKRIDRLEKAIDRKHRRAATAEAERDYFRSQLEGLQQKPIEGYNRPNVGDSDQLTLSRSEFEARVRAEAEKLAPTMSEQKAAIEHRQGVVAGLAKSWGQEKFDAVAADLDEALGGLADSKGKPKPATDAIFEADDPKALIEYLADPEHADEAEALSRMSAVQLGKAIAKMEARIAAKPERSKVPAPLDPIKGGLANTGQPNPSDTKAWVKWANEQERKSRS